MSDVEKSDASEAAETLAELQRQLQEMESAREDAEEAAELASTLETASQNVASVGQQLQDTTETLATACQDLSKQPTVSPKALQKIAGELKRLKNTVDAAELNNPRPKPRKRSDDGTSSGYGLTVGVLVLLAGVLGLQVLIWYSLPGAQQSTSLESEAASQPEAASQAEAAPQAEAPTIETLAQVDVQVLNGVGESGLAAGMKSYLDEQGVSVAHVGNAPIGTFDETTIFVHKRAFGVADTLATRLGLSSARVRPGPTTEAGPGLTIVVGADYESLSAYETERTP